ANWRLMAATFGGDVAAAEAIAAEMNLAAETAVDEAELLADLAKAPHIPPLPDPHGTADDPVGFLQMLMGMRFGRVRPVPGFLQALAADGSG
ncbi:MAG: hypothetical protein KC425_03165, partial [Anaerolineales bacterium]|nr:hypothetical protein [Anaerolineales bacterium]